MKWSTTLLMCWKWLHVQFCGGDIFVIQMMFSVNMVNTKVVDNFLVLLVLNFHDFGPDGLGVIDFRSLLLGFACPLDRSEWLYCLAYVNMESCIGDSRIVVVLFLSFLKCLVNYFWWSRTLVIAIQSGMVDSVQI